MVVRWSRIRVINVWYATQGHSVTRGSHRRASNRTSGRSLALPHQRQHMDVGHRLEGSRQCRCVRDARRCECDEQPACSRGCRSVDRQERGLLGVWRNGPYRERHIRCDCPHETCRSSPNWARAAYLNDMWHYNMTSGMWRWMTGASTASGTAAGVYGTLKTPAAANTPGVRAHAEAWVDSKGALWMFGGEGNGETDFGMTA